MTQHYLHTALHDSTLSLCHFVTLSHNGILVQSLVRLGFWPRTTLMRALFALHDSTLSLCHFVTLSLCHFVTLSLCHVVTVRNISAVISAARFFAPHRTNNSTIRTTPQHFVTLSLCHFVTLSLCHFVTLSLCHFVTLSLCHFVTVRNISAVISAARFLAPHRTNDSTFRTTRQHYVTMGLGFRVWGLGLRV